MTEEKDDELEHLRSLLARAHEKGELPSRKVIKRMMTLLRDRLKKKSAPEGIKRRKNTDAA